MNYNKHLSDRMQQRAIKQSTIDYVLHFGTEFHKTGVLFYFSGIATCHRGINRPQLSRLVGTTVVSAIDHSVITVYRDRQNGLKDIKRKVKYNIEETESYDLGKEYGWAF